MSNLVTPGNPAGKSNDGYFREDPTEELPEDIPFRIVAGIANGKNGFVNRNTFKNYTNQPNVLTF